MPWNYKRYGSASDPIHKSHLNNITGDYGCPRQFRYVMDAAADGASGADEQERISGKAAAGTAAHETIARALSSPDLRAHLLKGGRIAADRVRGVFAEEMEREVGGRSVAWYGKDEDREDDVLAERVTMITGLLNGLHEYVAHIHLLEAGFVARLGEYWLSGHVDIVYRPKYAATLEEVAIADWKTGANKPLPIELDHGWEAGVYSTAVAQGYFFSREQIKCATLGTGTVATLGQHKCAHPSKYIAERTVLEAAMIELAERCDDALRQRTPETAAQGIGIDSGPYDVRCFATFPSEIHHVHLADYVPYKKAGSKAVKRAEDLKFHGYDTPQKAHKYLAGDLRGPAWLPVALGEHDLPRLLARLRNVVGMIRMGRFIDQVGERCNRCSFARECLTSGYSPVGDDRKELERALRTIPGGSELADALSADD